MNVYHWTDVNDNSSYYTSRREAESAYGRIAKDEDPGEWKETDALALINEKDDTIRMLRYLVQRLSSCLTEQGAENVQEMIDEWKAQHREIWGTRAVAGQQQGEGETDR